RQPLERRRKHLWGVGIRRHSACQNPPTRYLGRMQYVTQLIDIALHLDRFLSQQSAALGWWLYPILFLVIFAETGLVVTPILPGDSLLFGMGAIAALADSGISLSWLLFLLCVAAVLGDAVNYTIGYY